MRKLALLLAVAALAGPTTAAADSTSIVHMYGCVVAGGHVTAPAGTELVVRQGWGAKNVGLVHDFLNAQTSTLSINGAAPIDVSDAYGPVTDGFAAFANVPTGVVLATGESATFEFVVSLSHRILDGASFANGEFGEPAFGGPGLLWDFTCTVTGG